MNKLVLIAGLAVAAVAVLIAVLYVPRRDRDSDRVQPPVDIPALRQQAEGGQAQAQAQLGRLYAKGQGVPQSYAEAAKWYRRAADQKDADGEFALGELYEAGQGVARDPSQAAKWYQLAAENGQIGAQYSLGVLYEFGRGVARDPVQAARWYRRAADQGDALAQFNLGQRYDLGIGVSPDRIEAFKWLSLAALQGIPDAAAARDHISTKLSREGRSEAKRRVKSFVPKKETPGQPK